MQQHELFMKRAIELAGQSARNGNHPFGAVLVIHSKVILENENTVIQEKDVTRHAELNLISRASRILTVHQLNQATLYASTEPCAMCVGAMYWSGIRSLVYGCASDTLNKYANGGFVTHSRHILSYGLEPTIVVGPYLEEEACSVHREYWPPLENKRDMAPI
jgi:tRNA(Arg) A34 adenosine deaminase TadA